MLNAMVRKVQQVDPEETVGQVLQRVGRGAVIEVSGARWWIGAAPNDAFGKVLDHLRTREGGLPPEEAERVAVAEVRDYRRREATKRKTAKKKAGRR